ncbi:hypothetical protein PR048_013747 [Dryococelus australis]|uniref:PH domain-containing protein n=1 Tax=Dryococelus australis TaxID=614101 RepID=A0ABQ9HT64_9NEOP|nr:hypothetical protein PR048_013747 [Dryococelus australis]
MTGNSADETFVFETLHQEDVKGWVHEVRRHTAAEVIAVICVEQPIHVRDVTCGNLSSDIFGEGDGNPGVSTTMQHCAPATTREYQNSIKYCILTCQGTPTINYCTQCYTPGQASQPISQPSEPVQCPSLLGIFACGNLAGRCRWSVGFLRDLPCPPSFHSGAAPYSPQSPSSALSTSLLRAAYISSLTLQVNMCVPNKHEKCGQESGRYKIADKLRPDDVDPLSHAGNGPMKIWRGG